MIEELSGGGGSVINVVLATVLGEALVAVFMPGGYPAGYAIIALAVFMALMIRSALR
ncbi:MAG: hypothetical protein GXP25_05575 [Planctomycetes bacterium]|nr:hypothetical protein [Planctomycetota bacterium]